MQTDEQKGAAEASTTKSTMTDLGLLLGADASSAVALDFDENSPDALMDHIDSEISHILNRKLHTTTILRILLKFTLIRQQRKRKRTCQK